MEPDIVIRGGTVVDGTGAPGFVADVAIAGDRVRAIDKRISGPVVLDASGCIVCPGFIDIHTHYDAQVFWDPALTPSCFHGVTTVVTGNCGFSLAPTRPAHRDLIASTLQKVEDMDPAALGVGVPWDFQTFPEYLASVGRRRPGLNLATYIGHTPLRIYVMGEDASARAASEQEVEQMATIVAEAMAAGAAGFSTSFAVTHNGADGRPVPSRLADRQEIDTLFAAVGASGRGIIQLSIGDNLAMAEIYDLQRRVGVPISYAPLLTGPSGAHHDLLALNRSGRAAGADVWPQVTCRPIVFTMPMSEPFTLNPNPHFAALVGRPVEERRVAYADSRWRRQAVEAWASMGDLAPRWETFEIAESSARPELTGVRLSELAARRQVEPLDALLDVALAEPDLAVRVRCVMLNDNTEDLREILTDEGCTLGVSDAGAHVGMLCDAPLPTDFLGNWVRDRELMSVEAAVRKLSGVQADLFNFVDRGYLVDGAFADVVVFDPAAVDSGPLRRVADFPAGTDRLTADQPSGIRHVLVNGRPIRADGVQCPPEAEGGRGQVLQPARRGDRR